ncbi:MAG: aminotransferase class IV, partial [Flavobacteriales bacterium]
CLPGLTRRFVLDVAERVGIEAREADLSLTELYTAEEAFTTGTMGALAHVTEVDGRRIAGGTKGPLTLRMQQAYEDHILETATPLPF